MSPSTARIEAAPALPALGPLGWFLVIVRFVAIVATLIICVPLHLVTHAAGIHSPWPRLFLGLVGSIAGARLSIRGRPVRRDVFIIANHVSWIDILVLARATGTAFVAKAELDGVPVIGWLCRMNKTLFVSREDKRGVAGQVAMLRDALAETHAVTVFPEATTTDGHSLLPFKTSLLAVLEEAPKDLTIQPVFIDYGPRVADVGWVGTESGLHNALRLLARWRPVPVTVHFLDAFSPADVPGRKAIAAESRRQIEAAMTQSLGREPRPFTLHDQP